MSQIGSIIVDHAGAVAAGTASTIGAAAMAAGQVPVPDEMPHWLAWTLVIGAPAAAWLAVRIVAAVIAYHRARAKGLRALVEDGHPETPEEAQKLLERAARHDAWAAAFSAAERKGLSAKN